MAPSRMRTTLPRHGELRLRTAAPRYSVTKNGNVISLVTFSLGSHSGGNVANLQRVALEFPSRLH